MKTLEMQINELRPTLEKMFVKSKEVMGLYSSKINALQGLSNSLDIDYNANTIKGIQRDIEELEKDINKEDIFYNNAYFLYHQYEYVTEDQDQDLLNEIKAFIEQYQDYYL